MQWIRRKLTYANTMATIAVFLALGGTSIAAVSLSKNSVGAKQIKRNAVKAPEIARNAVGASEIRTNAVAGGDVADGTLGTLDLADGSIVTGKLADNSVLAPKIADNAVGSGEVTDGSLGANDLQPGLLDMTISVQREDFALPAGPGANMPGAEVDGFTGCAAGQEIIGGSVNTSSPAGATTLISRPATDNIGNGGIPDDGDAFSFWKGTARTNTNAAATMRVFAVCVESP